MYFDDFSFIDNINLFTGKTININEDGYKYGNIFKDEYKPYKNYSIYNLKATTDEGILKLKIMEETFIINDLNLYLDVHPNDNEVYSYFKKHENYLNNYIEEYQKKYGSIFLNSEQDKYNWINSPWPWEDKNV